MMFDTVDEKGLRHLGGLELQAGGEGRDEAAAWVTRGRGRGRTARLTSRRWSRRRLPCGATRTPPVTATGAFYF